MSTKPSKLPQTDKIVPLSGRPLPEPANATILIVGDPEASHHGIGSQLEDNGYICRETGTGEEALRKIDRDAIDLVLLDIGLPDMDGFEVLEAIREEHRLSELPVVMLTDHDGEETVVRALEVGANDFLTLDTNFQIAAARLQTQMQLREARRRLIELAHTDSLTGVMNRRAFFEEVEREHARFERTGSPYALLMIDIDHFKALNDTHGHAAGDRVLRAFARRLENETRSIDRVARIGGEEFTLLLPDTPYQKAHAAAERIRTFVTAAPFPIEGGEARITASIGLAAQPPDEPISSKRLLEQADDAMYEAKHDGRNCVRGWR